jgi:hypothetical protein
MTENREVTDSEEVFRIVDAIKPLLAGHSPDIQGAVVADLLAIWLAGHVDQSEIGCADKPETDKIRRAMLDMHVEQVWKLCAVNEKIMGL